MNKQLWWRIQPTFSPDIPEIVRKRFILPEQIGTSIRNRAEVIQEWELKLTAIALAIPVWLAVMQALSGR